MINSEVVAKSVPDYASIVHEVFSFAGGVNTRAAQLFMSKNSLFSLQRDQLTLGINVIRSKNGVLETRPGRVKVNATAVTPAAGDAIIRSMFELRRSDGNDKICMNAGNTFYVLSGSTWSSVGTFATANLRRSYCQFKEVLLGVDSTNDMCKYDGTTLSTIAAAPKGSAIASHRDRVWVLNGKTLSYCAQGDETDWSTPNNAGSVPVPVSRGKGGTALIPMWDRLIIFTHQQIFQLSGTSPSDFVITPINLVYGNSGTSAAVVSAGNDVYSVDDVGVHGLSVAETQNLLGDVTYNYVSGPIENSWKQLAAGNHPNMFALNDKQNNLVLFFGSESSNNNDSAWVADYYHLDSRGMPTWTRYTNMPFACGIEVKTLSGKEELLFGGYDGIVYKQTAAEQDDTANIPISLQYLTDMELPHFDKNIRHLLLFTAGREGLMNVSASFDFGDRVINKTVDISSAQGAILGSTFVMGTSAIGTSAFRINRVALPGHGRFVRINLVLDSPARLTLGGFMIVGGVRRLLNI